MIIRRITATQEVEGSTVLVSACRGLGCPIGNELEDVS
jgi:hypothetical protein